MEDDLGLIEQVASGDVDALAVLYDRRGPGAYRIARRILLDPDAAEEVVQDAFLRVWRAAGSFRGGSVVAWVTRIVVNLSRDRLRRRRGPRSVPLDETTAARDRPGPDVERAVAALPDLERTTLVLRYYEGMTHRQVAMLTGVSLRTTKYRAARALDMLKEILDEGA